MVVEGRWWTERVRCRWAVGGDAGGMQRCGLELSGASHYSTTAASQAGAHRRVRSEAGAKAEAEGGTGQRVGVGKWRGLQTDARQKTSTGRATKATLCTQVAGSGCARQRAHHLQPVTDIRLAHSSGAPQPISTQPCMAVVSARSALPVHIRHHPKRPMLRGGTVGERRTPGIICSRVVAVCVQLCMQVCVLSGTQW